MDYRSLERKEAQIRHQALAYAIIINGLLIAGLLYFGGAFSGKDNASPQLNTNTQVELPTQVLHKKDRA